jgi:hypothetical protein
MLCDAGQEEELGGGSMSAFVKGRGGIPLLFAVCCLLSTVCCLLSAVNCLLSIYCLLSDMSRDRKRR